MFFKVTSYGDRISCSLKSTEQSGEKAPDTRKRHHGNSTNILFVPSVINKMIFAVSARKLLTDSAKQKS